MNLRHLRALACLRLGMVKWLFIHIPKNAGVALAKHPELANRLVRAEPSFHINKAYTAELLKVMQSAGEHHGYQHARWRDIRMDLRQKLQPVAIIRNPWARVVSRFHFAQTVVATGTDVPDLAPDSFEEFLDERHIYGNRPFYWHRAIRGWYPQADYVCDENGAIQTDILRQEYLAKEASTYFALKTPPRQRNVSTASAAKGYASYYTPKTIQIVADWYQKDIALFGFDFDTAAQRNCCYGE